MILAKDPALEPRSVKRAAVAAALVLAAIFALTNLGGTTLHEWDEARHGQIALEMMRRGDYINYYYAGTPDEWFAKPPLAIWSIVASYKLFGFTPFALRFPSAVAAILAVLVAFRFARRYEGSWAALAIVTIMVSCKGLMGWHVGRTGDTDALHVLFITLFATSAVEWVDFGSRRAAAIACVALALCFWSKGTACVFLIPGVVLYMLLRGRLRAALAAPEWWFGISAFLVLCASWYVLLRLNSVPRSDAGVAANGNGSWQIMWVYDTWRRFSTPIEGHGNSLGKLFSTFDVRFSPWIYVLGTCAAVALFRYGRARGARGHVDLAMEVARTNGSLWLACVCSVFPFVCVLAASRSLLPWYVAPATPFIACLTWLVWQEATKGKSFSRPLFWFVAVSACTVHLVRIIRERDDPSLAALRAEIPRIKLASTVFYFEPLRQNERLLLSWHAQKLEALPLTAKEKVQGEAVAAEAGLYRMSAAVEGSERDALVFSPLLATKKSNILRRDGRL